MNHLSWLGLGLSLTAFFALGFSGPGCRWGWWGHKTGIGLMEFAGFLGVAAFIACLAGLGVRYWEYSLEGGAHAFVGLFIAGGILGWMWKWKRSVDRLPCIHDITTDTENPPSFKAVLPLRADAENSVEYGGPILAQQQKNGYPKLEAGWMSNPPQVVYGKALKVAEDMGWEIVDSDPKSLRIEATDTTRWFGVKDDIVVRLTSTPVGSRIDVRSASRVGKCDFGTNARRINTYLARITPSSPVQFD